VRPFYDVLHLKYKEKQYVKNLIFNMDETNLLVKKFLAPSVILPTESSLIATVEETEIIRKCTACMTI
jgi:hypothetical protein